MISAAAFSHLRDRGRWLLVLGLVGLFSSLQAAITTPLAAGSYHSLFVRPDGTLWAMGYNGQGQLGDGTFLTRTSPVQVASQVKAVAAGGISSYFIKEDGTLWGMGYNGRGQLGTGTFSNFHSTPVLISQNTVAVAAGADHCLFVKTDGSLWAMGANNYGQLGDGTTTDRAQPVPVTTGVLSVTAGTWHSGFIKTDGSLWMMGNNSFGQFGNGAISTAVTNPIKTATGVAQVACGYAHTVFTKTDRSLWAAGFNSYGQLGDGTLTDHLSPVRVASDIVQIGCGSIHTLAVKSDGSLWAAGWNRFGSLGANEGIDVVPTFRFVATGVTAVATGVYNWHSLFQKADYSVHGMGLNNESQLGALPYSVYTPTQLIASPFGAPEVSLEPVALTVTGGQSAGFSVAFAGEPAPTLQWQRLAARTTTWADLADAGAYAGTTTSTLTIDPALPGMSGDSFRCVATNLVGSAISASATLTVLHPLPAPTITPGSGAFPLGQTITLAIAASEVDLRYTLDGSEPTEASTLYTAPFAIDPPLTLKVTGFKTGQPPSPTITAEYERLLPPVIVFFPESRTISRGATLSLTAIATGGNLSYQWYAGESGDTTHPVAEATASTLALPATLATAQYWLRASNAAGQADSDTITLTVNVLPLDNWTVIGPTVTNTFRGLAVGGSGVPPQVIAVGQPRLVYGANASSVTDSATWIQRISSDTNWTITSVIWTGARFVATGRGGDWYVSTNGVQWTTYLNGNIFTLVNRIATDGTNYVAVGDGGGVYRSSNITSTSGWSNWSQSGANLFYDIIWTGEQFVCVGWHSSLGAVIYTSPNGMAWNLVSSGLTTSALRGIVYANNQYVAVGANGTVLTSSNATTWTVRTSGVTADLKAIAWSGRRYLAVGSGGTIITSPNGIDWTPRYSGLETSLEAVLWESNYSHFIVAGASGRILMADDDPPGPPAIITHPINRTIGRGLTTTLQVTASGTGLTYQWYQGISGDTRTPLAGKTTATMTTPALTADTLFWVRITNSSGFINSNASTVNVVQPPVITVHPLSHSLTIGDNVQLSATATGTGPITYRWQRRPAASETWSNLSDTTPFGGTTTATLAISAVLVQNAGDSYRLAATNLGGTVYSEPGLIVASQLPSFTVHPQSATRAAFTSVSFTAQGTGYPAPTFHWELRAGPDEAWVLLTDGEGVSGSSTDQVTLTTPSASLNGSQIRRVASSIMGLVPSNPATLTVTRLNQTISFATLADRDVADGAFALTATASSGLSVTYSSSNPSVATVSGNIVTPVAAGSTTITASQSGNVDWLAAAAVPRLLNVIAAVVDDFSTWAEDLGLTGDDALPGATPFADGLANVVRYAMNLNTSPHASHLPTVAVTHIENVPHLTLEYRQRKNLEGVTLIPQWSQNLTVWEDIPLEAITQLADVDETTERYLAIKPLGTNGQMFMRVRVTTDS